MAPSLTHIPTPYRLFFLHIEPLSTIIGAIYAHLLQPTYLSLTDHPSYLALTSLSTAPPSLASGNGLPTGVSIALTQLANLYLAFALNEALVLRSTADVRVWRALLFGLLVADFGHLWSVHLKGWEVYWEVWRWNAIDWGNVGFVYCGAMMRICFLMGVGVGVDGEGGGAGKKRR